MNESLKKYSNMLSQIMLETKEEEVENILSAYTKMLKDDGVILSADSIMREASRLARREIESRTVTLNIASTNFSDSDEQEMKKEISAQMKKQGKDDIFIKKVRDDSLISGVVIDFPGTRVDSSLSGGLKSLASHIKS